MEHEKPKDRTCEQDEPSGTKAKGKSESQARTSYQIRRDWLSRETTASVAESQASSASHSAMMQRWLKEPMREQPYNNVRAVLEKKDLNNGGPTTREGSARDWTVPRSEAGSERK